MKQEKKFTPVNFAQHLATLLHSAGITQKRLAEDVGVSPATIVKWLSGTVPMGGALNRLAAHFGLHPDFLLNPAKYGSPFVMAAKVAAALEGTEEEKQKAYEQVLRRETEKLKARSAVQDPVQDNFEAVQNNWQARALAAEKQLENIRTKLGEILKKL